MKRRFNTIAAPVAAIATTFVTVGINLNRTFLLAEPVFLVVLVLTAASVLGWIYQGTRDSLPSSRSTLTSLLKLTVKYILGLVLIAGLFFILSFIYAFGRNEILYQGRFNEMMGFGESIFAAIIYVVIVCPAVGAVFIVQIILLVRESRRRADVERSGLTAR